MKLENASAIKYWLAGCLAMSDPDRPLPPVVDQGVLLRLVEAEGLSALLVDSLRRRGHLRVLPEQARTVLLARERQAAALDVRRQEDVVQVLETLTDAGLDFLLLKGEALAHSHYPVSHLRPRSDTDLLFSSREEAERAWAILQRLGFSRSRTLQGEFVGYQFTSVRQQSAGLAIQFDVHHQISDYLWFARRLTYSELYRSRVPVQVGGASLHGPDACHALLHACIHRMANKPFGTADRLIWLYDMHLLVQSMNEKSWLGFVQQATEKNLARPCLEALLKTREFFATEMDLVYLSRAAEKEPKGMGSGVRRWQLYAADFWHNRGVRNKALQLKEHLLPPADYMLDKYTLANRRTLPYFYLKRVLEGLVKYGH